MRPTWGQVRQFCQRQGYPETRTGHFRYVKVLPDRSTSGTMVSMGVDSEEVPPEMWRLVWRRQLRLDSEEEFWKGLQGQTVRYATGPVSEPLQPLPDYLLPFLEGALHWSEHEIAATTREHPQRLLNDCYARELREP